VDLADAALSQQWPSFRLPSCSSVRKSLGVRSVLAVGLERFNNARCFIFSGLRETTLGAITKHEFLETFAVERRDSMHYG
jgi:hypothetical protein